MELVINRRGIDVNLSYEHKQQCPRCVSEGRDRSGNNLHVYGLDARGKHKGAKCFACDYTIPSEEWLEENGHVQEEEISWTMIQFTEDDHKRLKPTQPTILRTGVESQKQHRSILACCMNTTKKVL